MAKIRLDADARAALAEFEKLAQKTDDLADGQDKLAAGSRGAAAEERRLGNLRKKLYRDTDTAQEKFEKRLRDATKALEGTGTSEKRLGKIRDRLHGEYLKDLAKEQREITGVSGKLDKTGSAASNAFDPSRLVSFAAGFAAPTAILGGLINQLRSVRAEIDGLADAQESNADTAGALVQLAGGDSSKRDQLFAASDRIFGQGFVADRGSANRLTFELESSGKLGESEFFSRLSAIEDAAALAKATGLIETAFSGGDDVGSSRDVISKAIAGALPATGVSAEGIAGGAASAAAAATPFRFRDEEIFAAVSRVSQSTGNGNIAGTQVRALLEAATRQGLADELSGQGLNAVIGTIADRAGGSAAGLQKFLGSSEAAKAFNILRDTQSLNVRISEIEQAQRTGLADATIQNAISSERLSAVFDARASEAESVLQRDPLASRRNRVDARIQSGINSARDEGSSELALSTASFVIDRARDVGFISDERLETAEQSFVAGLFKAALSEVLTPLLKEGNEEAKKQTSEIKKQQQGIPVR